MFKKAQNLIKHILIVNTYFYILRVSSKFERQSFHISLKKQV